MTRNDEDLQRMFDDQDVPMHQADSDTKAYQKVYETLKQPPSIHLSENFADKVVARAVRQRKQQEQWYTVSTVVIVIVSLVLSALAIYYTDAAFFQTLTRLVVQTKEIIAFIVVMVVLVQLGDRWLVKKVV